MEQPFAFLAIAAVVIITPGPDTFLTINNTLGGGRRAGIATAIGVANGQAIWTLATAAGISALLVASEPVFVALKVVGAAYLVFLGLRSVWGAVRKHLNHAGVRGQQARGLDTSTAYRRGLLSNLGNPKMAVFFPSLLPQFVQPDGPVFFPILALGLVFCLMTLCWLMAYAGVVARAGDVLRNSTLRRWLEGVGGAALVLLGIGLALEPRRS
ncbi:MAG TPA: LysE family translocator [Candidatus Limnocylindria bacterium]